MRPAGGGPQWALAPREEENIKCHIGKLNGMVLTYTLAAACFRVAFLRNALWLHLPVVGLHHVVGRHGLLVADRGPAGSAMYVHPVCRESPPGHTADKHIISLISLSRY